MPLLTNVDHVLKISNPKSFNAVKSVLVLGSLLLLSNVGIVDTVKILLVCSLQIFGGALLLEKFFFRRPLSVFEVFGLGLPIGAAISIAFDLLFVQSSLTKFAWLLPLVLIIVISKFVEPVQYLITRPDERLESEYLKWVVVGLLAVLGQEWFWPMPVAIFLSVGLLFKSSSATNSTKQVKRTRISQATFLLGVIFLFVGLVVRPNSWWIEDSDFGFYEAFTVSLSNWGLSENLLSVGSGLKYHWLVYEWSGLVSKATNLSNWVMLSRGVIIVGGFSVVCSIWLVLGRVVKSRKYIVPSFLLVCFFDSVTSWGSGFRIGFIVSPSQLVGFVWLFAIFVVLLEQDHHRIRYSPVLYGVLFSGAMLSKISHGVVALAGLLLLLVVEVIQRRSFLIPRLGDALMATAATIFWFWHTYFGAENAQIKFLKFPEEILGTLKLWGGKPLWAAAIILLLGLVGFQFFGLLAGLFQKEIRRSTHFIFALGAAIAGLIISVSVESLFGSQLYFLHSASALVLLVIAPLTVDSAVQIMRSDFSCLRVCVVAVAGLFSAVISWAIPTVNSGSESATWLSVSKSGVFILPILFALIFAINRSLQISIARFMALGLIGLSSLGIGFSLANWTMVLKREFPSFDRNEQFNLGTKDLNSAMRWMRDNTNENAIFASNNESYLLSSLSHRRGFLQAEEYLRRHTVLDAEWTEVLRQRRELMSRAFKDFSQSDVEEFKNFGVNNLVIDKSVPDFTLMTFPNGAKRVFENETFLVLNLD